MLKCDSSCKVYRRASGQFEIVLVPANVFYGIFGLLNMLSRLSNILAFTKRPSYPSVVLILALAPITYVLHIVPENSATERVDFSCREGTKFRYCGSKEQSREQLGTVCFNVGDGEDPGEFLDEIGKQVTQSLKEKGGRDEEIGGGVDAVDQALRSAVLDSLQHKRGEREPLKNTAQLYPVFLVQIDRPHSGKIITDAALTSFPH